MDLLAFFQWKSNVRLTESCNEVQFYAQLGDAFVQISGFNLKHLGT